MSRIKNIVEQGKQDLGINHHQYGTAPLANNTDGHKSGKLVLNYTDTARVEVSEQELVDNRIIAQNHLDPRAKRFQLLRTKVLQKMRKKDWNTIAITAPTKGAGKSLLAVNLAVSIATEGNQSVLLVDMNLGSPSIHKFFSIEPEFGIHDYLDGSANISDMLVNPGVERLVVLPGRRNIVNSSEQISSPLVKDLVQELKNRYESRIVIFDLPSILGSDEVMVFLPYVDCSLLVVEAGRSTPEEVEESLEIIGTNPLLGAVLNRSTS